MRRTHTQGVQVIGLRGRSDSKDGNLRGQETWRGVLNRYPERNGWEGLNQCRKRCQLRYAYPMHVCCGGLRRNLRRFIRPNLRPAAAHFFHLSALPVHRTTACTFFAAHRGTGHAGQHRRNGSEQKEDRDDAGESARGISSIKRRVYVWVDASQPGVLTPEVVAVATPVTRRSRPACGRGGYCLQ
jgi:hypothetical protein